MTEQLVRPRRSFIFSFDLKPAMYPKALGCGADIVCVELEDGIAPKDEATARERLGAVAVFTPDADQVERARRIIRTFEAVDTGLVVIAGKLIEKPVLRVMHRILAIAERVSARFGRAIE